MPLRDPPWSRKGLDREGLAALSRVDPTMGWGMLGVRLPIRALSKHRDPRSNRDYAD